MKGKLAQSLCVTSGLKKELLCILTYFVEQRGSYSKDGYVQGSESVVHVIKKKGALVKVLAFAEHNENSLLLIRVTKAAINVILA